MKTVKRAVFLGDSITMGYGLENRNNRYPSLFCRMIGAEEINYGITGTLMAWAGTSAFDGTSYIDRYQSMEDGDLIVVFGATNDYYWSDVPICGDGDDDRYFSNAVEHLCIGLREKYSDIPVVFIMPYRMRGIGNYLGGTDGSDHNRHNTDCKNYVGSTLEDYVKMQKEICLEQGMFVLDLFRDFGADIAHSDADESHYTLDGCHPNSTGHRHIAELLYMFCTENTII